MSTVSASKSDPFGFDQLQDSGELDLSAFAPKSKGIDRQAAAAAAAVARDSGFTRRQPASSMEAPQRTGPEDKGGSERGKKRRVNISELLGLEDRYPETERAQLNMLVPVPVFLRWRKLVIEQQLPAWEVLESALSILESQAEPSSTEASANG